MAEMEELIKEEIARIPGLTERVAFKDLVEQVFLSLYETNRDMYEELERRIMDDLSLDLNRCQICTGIVEREYVDSSHHYLSPMKEEDLKKPGYDAARIRKELLEAGSSRVKTLFLECDYLQMKKLLEKKKIHAVVQTAQAKYETMICIRENRDYLEEISHLYGVFINNGIPWQTVNAPYLYKFVGLYLEDWPQDMPETAVIEDIRPDLEEFERMAHDNCVPVWNIKKLELDSVGFPVPCEDHKSFEHTISIREYGGEHVYLIDDREHIFHVRQNENRLMVTGGQPEACRWKVYMIRSGQNRKFERFTWPLMTNSRKDEFVERFWRRQGMAVRTGAELARFLNGFGMEEYVEYTGYEITDRDGEEAETYSMNSFIADEINEPDARKRLVLLFNPRGGNDFLLRDIMSFLVSEVQLLYPQYWCRGRLLQGGR